MNSKLTKFFFGPERDFIANRMDSKALLALRILSIGILTIIAGFIILACGVKPGALITIGGFFIAFVGLVFHVLLAIRNVTRLGK